MFRKPREQIVADVQSPLRPSVGRPPTPPPVLKMKTTPKAPNKGKKTQPRVTSFFAKATGPLQPNTKSSKQQNDSILKFFKKVDSPVYAERSIFLGGENGLQTIEQTSDGSFSVLRDPPAEDEERFNEVEAPSKRRRVTPPQDEEPSKSATFGSKTALYSREDLPNGDEMEQERVSQEKQTADISGPFAEDSDSDHDNFDDIVGTVASCMMLEEEVDEDRITKQISLRDQSSDKTTIPILTRESTSFVLEDDFDKFDDLEGEEFYGNGEEFLERRYMEEQAALEQDFEDDNAGACEESKPESRQDSESYSEVSESSCPICNISLKGISSQDASIHVNNCLDGNPSQPPKSEIEADISSTAIPTSKRFQRAAIPRPGQANPFSLAPTKNGSSAFSKLMSSHAEDEAWATAAANEASSRGKPAFKRTCPFYKILPGFFTCVDAFRFGAVEGCNAYFLSHFHSDHYIGLTSSWCHGPIYCSRITGNLVRQQLRVNPKYVVDLEWEKKVEIPNTQGVCVTMIPANHCPGSSLYLFEKQVGKGPDPRLQRVLHCGDFRACTAHVKHPLLRPDVIDAVSGKSRQQRLNVCYLDTTYLTPKYAFPPQDQVVKACADMCVSLSKDKVDEMDAWERTKKARAGSGMVKFVQKEGETADDAKESNTEPSATSNGRGRLLVVVGTYSIGKERICLGIARALQSKIYAPPNKKRICLALEDPELTERLTDDPYDAQVHMQMLMEIRPETLADYLTDYKPRFSRVVGFRPTGWNYRPPNSRFVESPLVQTVLHSENWKTSYSMAELMPQRGSTRESNCFGVPYSEHSSFRELTMFCCALRIDKIIPTVNVGSAKSREKMKGWIEKWAMEKKKNGLYEVDESATSW